MAAERGFRRRTVEEDTLYAPVGGQEGVEVIGCDAGWNDAAVQASLPFTALKDVPQGETRSGQFRKAFRIGKIGAGANQHTQNFPEMVSGVCIVLTRAKRSVARHAAENEGVRIGGHGGRKAVYQGHGFVDDGRIEPGGSPKVVSLAIEQGRQAVV